jgi:O-antigen/teichoic acid export membrane protein
MLLFGTVGNALVAFLTQLLLTRSLDVRAYGQVVAITAAVTMLIPVAGMTTGWFWLELYGRERQAAVRWGHASRQAAVLTLVVSGAVLTGYLVLASGGRADAVVLACAGAMLLGQTLAESRAVRLQLEERYFALALWQTAPQALRSIAVVALLSTASLSGHATMVAYAVAGLVTAMLALPSVLALTNGSIRLAGVASPQAGVPRNWLPGIRVCLKAAWPYALVTLFYLIYSTGILALLNPLIGAEASAYYNIGFLIFNSLAMLPSVIYGKYLAGKLFRWWTHDQDKFVAAFHLGVASHFVLGLVLGALTAGAAPFFVPLLFGASYRAAVPVVQILAVGVPIRFVQHGYGAVLFSKDHIRRKVAYMGQAALLSVLLLFWLAPLYGVKGAAACSVAAEALLLGLYIYGAASHVGPIDVRATLSLRTLNLAYRRLEREG